MALSDPYRPVARRKVNDRFLTLIGHLTASAGSMAVQKSKFTLNAAIEQGAVRTHPRSGKKGGEPF
jgi:hypothetical protein